MIVESDHENHRSVRSSKELYRAQLTQATNSLRRLFVPKMFRHIHSAACATGISRLAKCKKNAQVMGVSLSHNFDAEQSDLQVKPSHGQTKEQKESRARSMGMIDY